MQRKWFCPTHFLVIKEVRTSFSWSLMATFVDSNYSAALSILWSLNVAFSDVGQVVRKNAYRDLFTLQSVLGLLPFVRILSYLSCSLVDTYGARYTKEVFEARYFWLLFINSCTCFFFSCFLNKNFMYARHWLHDEI